MKSRTVVLAVIFVAGLVGISWQSLSAKFPPQPQLPSDCSFSITITPSENGLYQFRATIFDPQSNSTVSDLEIEAPNGEPVHIQGVDPFTETEFDLEVTLMAVSPEPTSRERHQDSI